MESVDRVPRAHSPVLRFLGKSLIKCCGFTLDAPLPNEPRFVLLLAPHTSNWDFALALATVTAVDLRANWFAKHTIFRWPFGAFFRWLGGIPLDRGSPRAAMKQITGAFKDNDQLVFCIAPEGTRSRIEKWKPGFYVIAHAAKVPILCGYVDYGRKICGTGPVIFPSGDYAADIERIQAFYRTITPKFPEKFAAKG
jgi:1-acyl-sn-glycerol-3-phosphate acyltransferase